MKAHAPSPAEQHDTIHELCPWLDPGGQGEKLDFHQFPTFMMLRLATLTKSTLSRSYLDPHGVSLPEWRLLALVARHGSLMFSEITTGAAMDKGQVSRTLKSIHAKGLVTLDSIPSDDRPRHSSISPRLKVSISGRGKDLYDLILPASRSWQARFLDKLSAEERQVFHSVSLRLMQELPELAGADLGDEMA
ncbi:MAG: hypothetical protein RLZZ200_36 [Pseudomonadota bacterium]